MNAKEYLRKSFRTALVSVLLFSPAGLFCEEAVIEYLKGNISDKIHAVEQSSLSGDMSICLRALDFAAEEKDSLAGDADFRLLVKTAVSCLNTENASQEEKDKAAQNLSQIFISFDDGEIRIAVLDKIKKISSQKSVNLLNSFVSDKIHRKDPIDDLTIKAIMLLGEIGDSNSFTSLFLADIMDVWPNNKKELRDAYSPLAKKCENEILTVFANVDTEKKNNILSTVKELSDDGEKIPKKICGELAENALSESIYSIGETKEKNEKLILLQLTSLQIASDQKWTRAAKLATEIFPQIRSAYESQIISDAQFATAIQNIASIASDKTGKVLSSYLEFLNKGMEQNRAPSQAVVLSVINALGGLGDKTAFDGLLYVTYLNYPENIVKAAKTALTKLKW